MSRSNLQRFAAAVSLGLQVSAAAAAGIQWTAAAQHYQLTEFTADGRSLLEESGLLPVLGARWTQPLQDGASVTSGVELKHGSVSYDGQSQTGVPVQTRTGIDGASMSSRLRWDLPGTPLALAAGAELEWFRRHIRGTGPYSGLDERSSQGRGLLGIDWASSVGGWRLARRWGLWSQVSVRAEGGLFDPVTLPGGRSRGWVIDWDHPLPSGWRLGLQWDRLDTPASTSRGLTLNGQPVGTVTAPRWRRDQLSLQLSRSLD